MPESSQNTVIDLCEKYELQTDLSQIPFFLNHRAKILSECVQDQYLYSFYPNFASIEVVAKRIASTNALVSCADAWELPPSLAQDLVKLALFDIVFGELSGYRIQKARRGKNADYPLFFHLPPLHFVLLELDDSASMRSEGTKRRDALASILRRAAGE